MGMQRFLMISTFISGVLLLVGSCKDMGNEVPPPPISAAKSDFTLVPGGVAGTRLSGGTLPYSFVSRGNTNIVDASITGDSLGLRGVGIGSTTIIVGDNGSPRLTLTVSITVIELAFGQTSFALVAGDSASTTIAGGTPPYVLISKGDTTKAIPSISGSLLKIRAIAAGSSSIVVGDNGSPRLSGTISANVIALVSFSAQVQPIFNAGCAVTGCHVPGGSGPMSLAAGVSFGTLVGVAATRGPCAGDNRVQPSNPASSALIKRLEGTCGTRMPIGAPQLSADQLQLMRDWISQGARNN